LDASGAGIVDWLATIGIDAENDPDATWQDVTAAAGHQPMLVGGRAWNHWTGVRIWTGLGPHPSGDWVALANPAPGWMGVEQWMGPGDFEALGPFSAVWLIGW
jgi:hypothetical protein